MFLPTLGVNRDRTADFISLKGSTDKEFQFSKRDATDATSLLTHERQSRSVLEPFFQLSSDIKAQLKQVKISYSELLRAQQQCLRPTFADASDQIMDVTTLTTSISSQIKSMQNRVNYMEISSSSNPDRDKILQNLKVALSDSIKKFSTEFKMAQQAFNASYSEQPQQEVDQEPSIDFSSLNFGEANMNQELFQSEDLEIEALVRRAAEVREIFADLSNLIIEQGTVVDRIDYNISESLDNAVLAHKELQRAAKHQQKSRMWLCVIILAIIVTILFICVIMK